MGEVWVDIHADLLLTIAKYTTTKDHIVLRAVCKAWGSVLSSDPTLGQQEQQLPWGLFPCRHPGRCLLYSIAEQQQYLIDLPEFYRYRCCGSSHGWLIFTDNTPAMFMLNPLTRRRVELPPITTMFVNGSFIEYDETIVDQEYCYTCGGGWKIRRDSESMKRSCISTAILTGNPSLDKEYLIIALSSENGYLGICREGDDKWTSVDMVSCSTRILNVVYWKGSLYGISYNGRLVKCDDLQDPTPCMKLIAWSRVPLPVDSSCAIAVAPSASASHNFFLVYRRYGFFPEEEEENNDDCFCRGCHGNDDEDSDDPYDDYDYYTDYDGEDDDSEYENPPDEDEVENNDVVDGDDLEYTSSDDYEAYLDGQYLWRTDKLVVFMLNEQGKWVRVWDIGDNMLFLGTNSSIVVPTRDFPECNPNHIYFSHGYDNLGCKENDMGVMDIKNNKRQSFSGCSRLSSNLPKPVVPHFVWFVPSL